MNSSTKSTGRKLRAMAAAIAVTVGLGFTAARDAAAGGLSIHFGTGSYQGHGHHHGKRHHGKRHHGHRNYGHRPRHWQKHRNWNRRHGHGGFYRPWPRAHGFGFRSGAGRGHRGERHGSHTRQRHGIHEGRAVNRGRGRAESRPDNRGVRRDRERDRGRDGGRRELRVSNEVRVSGAYPQVIIPAPPADIYHTEPSPR